MERRKPDYEDEKIREWRADPDMGIPERDSTVLDIDLEREEIYESRVYEVTQEALNSLALEVVVGRPERLPPSVLQRLFESLAGSSFRILAKQDREDKRLTWVQISILGGRRDLMEQVDRRPEEEFRSFVMAFESDAVAGGLAHEPTVVTLEEWRQHEQRNRVDST